LIDDQATANGLFRDGVGVQEASKSFLKAPYHDNSLSSGSILIKDPNAPEVFLFETEDGLIRHVRSPEAMDLFSLAWEKIQFVPGAVIRHLRRGVDITNGSLLGFALTGLPFPEEQLKTVGDASTARCVQFGTPHIRHSEAFSLPIQMEQAFSESPNLVLRRSGRRGDREEVAGDRCGAAAQPVLVAGGLPVRPGGGGVRHRLAEWTPGDPDVRLDVEQGDPAKLARPGHNPVVLARPRVRGRLATVWKTRLSDDLVCVSWAEGAMGLPVCALVARRGGCWRSRSWSGWPTGYAARPPSAGPAQCPWGDDAGDPAAAWRSIAGSRVLTVGRDRDAAH
jgi:hypothetical protein